MIKYYCDACGKEIKGCSNKFRWLCHLTDIVNGKIAGYADIDGNCVSGREEQAELCNKCYNNIVILSVKKYFELKEIING
jgi:hypothetical protein